MSRRRRSPVSVPEITLTPLIDTALTLLIIFMVTTPMLNNAIRVDLPKGSVKEDAHAKQELIVYIDNKENIFVNGSPVTSETLIKAIQDSVAQLSLKMVVVKADQAVRYGSVIEIVDQIKKTGSVDYVALATKKKTV